MSTLTVTNINTANGTTDLTIKTGNTTGPALLIQANGNALVFQGSSTSNVMTVNSTTVAFGPTSFTANNITANNLVVSTNTTNIGTALYVIANGNLGIGTSSPANKLEVSGTSNASSYTVGTSFLANTTAANIAVNTQIISLGVGTAASGTTGEIRATNEVTAYYSDKRLKDNIEQIQDALNKVKQINGVTYTQSAIAEQYGYSNYSKQVGVIAQEVQQVLPEAIRPAPFDIDESGNSKSGQNYLTVKYENLIPLLIEAIKQLTDRVEQLERK